MIPPLGPPALLDRFRDARWPRAGERARQQLHPPAERPTQRLVAAQPRPLWVLLEQQRSGAERLQLLLLADPDRPRRA